MRTTIDKAGRVVIPKVLRDHAGFVAGEVQLSIDGSGIRIDPVHDNDLVEEDGFLVIPASGASVDDDLIVTLRRADQR